MLQFLGWAPSATAQQVRFTKIVDTRTAIPGGAGTFTGLFGGDFDNGPSLSNGTVAFAAYGPPGYSGIFTSSGGVLKKVVDTRTLVPGKNIPFRHFAHASISGGTISFVGSFGADPPTPLSPPLMPTRDTAVFAHSGGRLNIIADERTPVPGGVGNFNAFFGGTNGGGHTAFIGYAPTDHLGMYRGRPVTPALAPNAVDIIVDRKSRVSILRELSFETVEPTSITIPGVAGEMTGDRFVIIAENATRNPQSQSRIEMLAANTGPLRIIREATVPTPRTITHGCFDRSNCAFQGFPNITLGNATLSIQTVGFYSVLQVDNIGSSGKDGVAQVVPESMEMETALLTPNFSRSSQGATLVTTQTGTVDGKRDQLFSAMTIVNIGGRLRVTGDWSLIGTTKYRIQVYRKGELVTSQSGLPSGELITTTVPDIARMICHIWIIGPIIVISSATVSRGDVAFCALDEEKNKAVLLYKSRDNVLEVVADRNTDIPRGRGKFTDFGVREGFDKGTVAFVGYGAGGQAGVYAYTDGVLRVVADQSTPIPRGTGRFENFSSLNDVSVSDGHIAFTGAGSGEQGGIYLRTRTGSLMAVVQNGDTLDGLTLQVNRSTSDLPWWLVTPPLNMNAEAFDGNELVFLADLPNSTGAIYKATIPNLGPVLSRAGMMNAASYDFSPFAPGQLVSVFGAELADTTGSAETPSQTSLAGTTVSITDSMKMQRQATLLFVSPRQINFVIPPETKSGAATLTVLRANRQSTSETVQIDVTAPALFSANADGKGVAAAAALIVRGNGSRETQLVFDANAPVGQRTAVPLDLGPTDSQVYLLLFGTGLGGLKDPALVKARIAGMDVPVLYAGPQRQFTGLDQINLGPLPRSLAGRGEVSIEITAETKQANITTVNIK